jgi:hypothetical protein
MPTINDMSWASFESSFVPEMYLGSQRVWPKKYIYVSSSYILGDNKVVYSISGGVSGVPTSIQGKTRYLARGNSHNLATLDDNTVVAWGDNVYGQCNVPSNIQGRVIKSVGGLQASYAILDDGSVRHWGRSFGQNDNIPAGLTGVIDLFTITFGQNVIAIKSDGTGVFWGNWSASPMRIPPGLNRIIKAAVGQWTNAFQQDDGSVVMDGYGSWTDLSASAEIIDFAFTDNLFKFRTLRLNGDFWEHTSTNVGGNILLAQNIAAMAVDYPTVVLRHDGTTLSL